MFKLQFPNPNITHVKGWGRRQLERGKLVKFQQFDMENKEETKNVFAEAQTPSLHG